MNKYSDYFKNTVDFTDRIQRDRKKISNESMGPSLAFGPAGKADRYIYDSKNTSKHPYVLVRKEGDDAVVDPAANKVYENAGKVRDFYKGVFNYFSVDNNGKDLIMNIHFQQDFNNAVWSSSTDEMFFGDGDGQILTNLTGPIDVIGHEMTHGVVEYTAGLVYQGQSGALNEHIADVFGTVIKQHYNGQNASNADWLIGEAVMGPRFRAAAGFSTIALRSLKDPGFAFEGDIQPSDMSNYDNTSSDNFGVHINSGILNKVFYLVASGDGMPTSGLDTPDAGKLWFSALKSITDDSCNFADFSKIVINSAQLMETSNILPAGAVTLVQAAFAKVGL